MSDASKETIVNAWNEWDPLKHVIVGLPDGTMIAEPEPGVMYEFPDAGVKLGEWGPLPEDLTAQAKEQMDRFTEILEERGIRVDRPTPLDFSHAVQTPDWRIASMFGCMPPRDLLLPVGNEILEATMSQRARWFEYLCYRPLLEGYFKEDPNFIWEAAPKPRLTGETFVDGYWEKYYKSWTYEEKMARMREHKFHLTEKEPLFDAADVFRFGKDLFVQRSAPTNAGGIDWLRRHFAPKGIRVHEIAFDGYPLPWHLDCTIIVPRPGLLIQNPEWMPITPEFHELFKMNGWEIVMAEAPSRPKPHPLSFCSVNLAYNTFSIDPETICVEAGETKLTEQLEGLGLEVIPVDFFEVSPFGGGLHCATVEIYREGDCEDYFPNQIEGF